MILVKLQANPALALAVQATNSSPLHVAHKYFDERLYIAKGLPIRLRDSFIVY